MSWIARNADWLSASFGILSSIVFAWPLLRDLPLQRFQDQLNRLTGKASAPASAPVAAARENDSADIERVAGILIRERLGGYSASRWTLGWGLFFLGLSFLLNLIYAVNKP